MQPTTTISVALCTYNGERFLQEQLDSIANQTRTPNEVIVCDDGSTDKTLEILKFWAKTVPFKVTIIQNECNLGYAKNFEKAITLCDGEIIFLCDQDDIWLPEKIETMHHIFKQNPNVGVVYCEGRVTDGNGNEHDLTYSQILLPRLNCSEVYYLTPNYKHGKSYAGCCAAIRQNVRSSIFPIPNDFTHDRWIFYTVPAISQLYFCDKTLIHYRIHTANTTYGQIIANAAQLETVRHFYRTAASNYFFVESKTQTLKQWLLLQPKTNSQQRILRWLKQNTTHFTNRSRIQRNSFFFFPLWILEIISLRYFRHNQPIQSIFYDFFAGIFGGKK